MASKPSIVFVPGSWHKPTCYNKIITPLQNTYKLKCIPVTLPSTTNNPSATFKDDVDAARTAIASETTRGHNVIVIAHSYGGMVGNSAIHGFTRPKNLQATNNNITTTTTISSSSSSSSSSTSTPQDSEREGECKDGSKGYVVALILIASGFTLTGMAFMDPFFGHPPPSWRIDKPSGYAVLVANPREFFYHDLPADEASYWVDQLTTQSLKALFEGGEHAYAGWMDVPTWYIGTIEDRGLPVTVQRVTVSMARAMGADVHHTELQSSHSPFLSRPDEVVAVILDTVDVVSSDGAGGRDAVQRSGAQAVGGKDRYATMVRLGAPSTWFSFGIPWVAGRMAGWGYMGFMKLRRLWRR